MQRVSWLIVVACLFVGFDPVAVTATLPPASERVAFNQHGGDWTQGNCGSRERQSPVNFDEIYRPTSGSFTYTYPDVHSQTLTLTNDGRTISMDMVGDGFGGIALPQGGTPFYNLRRIDFHASSEHTLRGKHAPLEVQLVHEPAPTVVHSSSPAPTSDLMLEQSSVAQPRKLVTVSILVTCNSPPVAEPLFPGSLIQQSDSVLDGRAAAAAAGLWAATARSGTKAADRRLGMEDPDFNPTLQVFVKQPPPVFDDKVEVNLLASDPLQLNQLLANGTFFMYQGSETLPPCDERVGWLVRREPVLASCAQVKTLFDRLYTTSGGAGNYRTIMPLNQRIVSVFSAEEHQQPPPRPPVSADVARMIRQIEETRESKSTPWARDAITIAKAAADYAKDLDFRLKASATAEMQGLEANATVGAPAPAPAPAMMPMTAEAFNAARTTTQLPGAVAADEAWALKGVTETVNQAVREAVEKDMKEVAPAAASLAKSYLRKTLLRNAGYTA